MVSKNPYQVICIGEDCRLYNKCEKECILKNGLLKHIKGCNYSKDGDCKYCSNKKKCILIKPYTKELHELEVKRRVLEIENNTLHEYVHTWEEIENSLDEYGVDSVTDVVYFDRTKQQMIDRINDNIKLINAYRKKEDNMVGCIYANKN